MNFRIYWEGVSKIHVNNQSRYCFEFKCYKKYMKRKLQRVISWFFYYLLDWPYIVYFNFKYLPVAQAYKLPVLLHKTRLCGGG